MGAILLSSLFALLGAFTLWPGIVAEVLRDHAVIALVALVLVGVAAEAVLVAIKTAEASRRTAATGRTP